MSMTGSGLASAVKSAIQAVNAEDRDFDAVWDAIGTAIINYIKTNAVVNVTSVSGVTAGAGVSGPGTGTLS